MTQIKQGSNVANPASSHKVDEDEILLSVFAIVVAFIMITVPSAFAQTENPSFQASQACV